MNKNRSENNFNGTTNFNSTAQIAAGDIYNVTPTTSKQEANYTPEPIWRSPFTLAVLTWSSVVIGIAGLLPLGKILKGALDSINGNINESSKVGTNACFIAFIILLFLFIIALSLRRIAKNQTRHPLLINFAISGNDEKITLEKIHTDKCPQCGGKMKYYNKAIEWREIIRGNGSVKREVAKKVPALECKRNAKHWYEVDPAEDKVY